MTDSVYLLAATRDDEPLPRTPPHPRSSDQRKDGDDRIGVVLQDSKQRHDDSHSGSPIRRLRQDPRCLSVGEFLHVKRFVVPSDDEHGSIIAEDRAEASSRVTQQAPVAE
jgi:hypothetical protein